MPCTQLMLTVAAALAALSPLLALAGKCAEAEAREVCQSGQLEKAKVADALAREAEGTAFWEVHLLQAGVAKSSHNQTNNVTAGAQVHSSDLGDHVNSIVHIPVVATQEMVHANNNREKRFKGNYTCQKTTGEMCLTSGECDQSTNAMCSDVGQCGCPSYTCAREGKCQLSLREIGMALKNGVSGVVEQVTALAVHLPGIADSLSSFLNGAQDTLGGLLGTLTGQDMNSCNSRYISTCLFYECDPDLGFSVSCVYGSCQCKEGFCAVDGKCVFDVQHFVDKLQG